MFKKKKFKYPLIYPRIYEDDKKIAINVINSGQITMSNITRKFEKSFAKYVGSKYAIMVNSGSSANLIAVTAACNPIVMNKLKPGDEILIPGICWSTSLWPLVQNGLKPIFVDVDTDTLNININDLKKKITKKTKGIFCVHVLGISTNMDIIKKISYEKNLVIIEDTCESLGSSYSNKKLGTFGKFGTYSFYYSHQISSGEGGMIVCNSRKDYELLLCLRAHGWSREGSSHKKIKRKYPNLDERFIFINMGFNVRPLEIQAAIGFNQLKQINKFKLNRIYNRNKIISFYKKKDNKNKYFKFIENPKKIECNWFGIPIMINPKLKKFRNKIIKEIEKNGIETRAIVSGNFLRQPAIKLFKLCNKNEKLINCDEIHNRGFFIGINTKKSTTNTLKFVAEKLYKAFSKFDAYTN